MLYLVYISQKKNKRRKKMVQPSNVRKGLCELKNMGGVCVYLFVGGYKLVVMNAN